MSTHSPGRIRQIEINLAIGIGTKDELSCVASLSHVVWNAYCNHMGTLFVPGRRP